MKIGLRIVLMLVGMVFVLGFSGSVIGCSSSTMKASVKFKRGTHSVKWSTSDGVLHYEYEKGMLPEFKLPLHFDLDSKEFARVGLSDFAYKYYFDNDCVYAEESHQLFLNDDPSWSVFFANSALRSHITPQHQYSFSIADELELDGYFSMAFDITPDLHSSLIELTIRLQGGSPIPFWDTTRWQTLERELFLFRDGVCGNPDPIVMRLTGEANDVLGYLYEVGIEEYTSIVEDNIWDVFIDDEGECADVFVNDILFNSIALN